MNKKTLIMLISCMAIQSTLLHAKNLELSDLGIDTQEKIEINSDLTSDQLEKRGSYLQKHQYWGLATLGLMVASFLFAEQAEIEDDKDGERESKSEIHQYLGIATSAAYWTTFYYQYDAPKPKNFSDKSWNMKLHKSLAWVHAPLMILTPIAGIQAWQAGKDGKKPSGLGKYKDTLGGLTMASFSVAATLMIIEF